MSSNISLSTLSNNVWTSSSTSNTVNTSSNPFVVNSGSNSALTVDSDGNTVIEKLVLKDEKTGRKWQLKISDGEIIVEPLEIQDKREWKIEKVLNENI